MRGPRPSIVRQGSLDRSHAFLQTLAIAPAQPAITSVAFGARYEFKLFGMNSTLRVQIQNVSDLTVWTAAYTPGYFLTSPRTVFAYLTTDI
jgi:hypothetical protein